MELYYSLYKKSSAKYQRASAFFVRYVFYQLLTTLLKLSTKLPNASDKIMVW
jgi:hypothetical protein